MIAAALSRISPFKRSSAAVSLRSRCSRSSTPDNASSGVCLSLRSLRPEVAARYKKEMRPPDVARRILYALDLGSQAETQKLEKKKNGMNRKDVD